jgi:hypothetical protein
VLAGDIAGLGLDQPFAAGLPLDGGHFGLPVDLGAPIAGPHGQGIGQVRRGDVAVLGMVERAHQAVGVAQRPELLDLLGRDDLERHADGVRGAAVLVVLVHPVPVGGEPQIAVHMERDILAGLLLQRLVEIDAVFVDLAHGVAHVEQRQEARGVPGRARRQLGALAQHHIAPTLLGQVIERADAHHTAADDHHPCVAIHCSSPLAFAQRPGNRASCGGAHLGRSNRARPSKLRHAHEQFRHGGEAPFRPLGCSQRVSLSARAAIRQCFAGQIPLRVVRFRFSSVERIQAHVIG